MYWLDIPVSVQYKQQHEIDKKLLTQPNNTYMYLYTSSTQVITPWKYQCSGNELIGFSSHGLLFSVKAKLSLMEETIILILYY